MMTSRASRTLGFARRVRLQLPFGARRAGWDCRQVGLGRIVAPRLKTEIEIARATTLDLETGEIRVASRAPTRV